MRCLTLMVRRVCPVPNDDANVKKSSRRLLKPKSSMVVTYASSLRNFIVRCRLVMGAYVKSGVGRGAGGADSLSVSTWTPL